MSSVAPHTFLIGLVGRGIAGSRSPLMHEREAAALGLTLVYRRIDFDALALPDAALAETLRLIEGIGFRGVNVTHPFKQQVLPLLDVLSPEAEALGAVNTVTFADGRRTGHNTDWFGFAESVRREIGDIAGTIAAQIGAGGAGSATAYALLQLGVTELRLVDADPGRAAALAARLAPHFPGRTVRAMPSAAAAIAGAGGVVQASPVGMTGHPGLPFDPGLMTAEQWLADVIYVPIETEIVQAARARGARAAGGLQMAVHQAAEAFRIFTGAPADGNRISAALATDLAAGAADA